MNYEVAELDDKQQREDVHMVQCVWCGAKIREDKEDTNGVCLKCFYQMLTNHLESQKRSPYGDFVSDR
jgi:DNA-directed RNA polymerase subunit RPC12/RpoP